MKYATYERYKPSMIEWLGAVPEHWEIWKIAHGFQMTGSGTTPPPDNPDWYDGDVCWVTTSELRETVITDTEKKISQEALKNFSALKVFPEGALAIAMYGATIGRLGIFGIAAATNQACGVLFGQKAFDTKFVFYWLQAFREQIILLASGGGQPNISQEKVRSVRIACPSIEEQQTIASFLDAKTAQIDALVGQKRLLIAKLKEKRSALIARTVTRGLPPEAAEAAGLEPNPEMKNSGVDWLGEIPCHWQVKRLRYLGDAIIGLTYDPGDVSDHEDGTLVLRSSNVQDGRISFDDNVFVRSSIPSKLRTRVGDILICSRNGSRALIGKNARIDEESAGITFGAFMTVFRSQFSEFLYWAFNSEMFTFQSGAFLTSTINQLTVNNLNSFSVALPPQEEQRHIALYLATETVQIDSLISSVETAIARLTEYRQALITSAVTGKIDVRGGE